MSFISSPCIAICTIDEPSGLCLGCGRSLAEIVGWAALTEAQRRRLMEILPDRLPRIGDTALDGIPAAS